MKNSRVDELGKIKYPKCNKKKEHAQEMLNLICLSQNCRNKGLFCSMCKSSEHSGAGHSVVPFKMFLGKA